MKHNITIIGAGPVGILTAIGLSKNGFSVQLLERMTKQELHKRADRSKLSRLYAISLGSYEIMKNMVGIDFNTDNFQPINQIFINDGKANTTFRPQEINEKVFGYMVEESDLFAQLIVALQNCSNNLNILYGVKDLEILDGTAHPYFREGALDLKNLTHSVAMDRDSQRSTCAHESSIASNSQSTLNSSNTARIPDALKASAPYLPARSQGPTGHRAGSSSDSVLIKAGDSIIESDLIFATDGRNSTFRKQLPFGENKKDYNELALVFKIKHENFIHEGLAVETFFPSGPFAILPHKEQNFSSIVWSAQKEKIEAFLSLNQDIQHELIAEKLPDFYSNFEFISEFITYPLHLNILDSLYYKNVLLLGDSSHVVHPVAGQGFNLGIRDVRDILNIIKDYDFYTDTDHMLSEYQKLRKRDISKLANSTDFLSDLFSNNSIVLKRARRLGLEIFDMLPKHASGLRSNTIKYAAGK